MWPVMGPSDIFVQAVGNGTDGTTASAILQVLRASEHTCVCACRRACVQTCVRADARKSVRVCVQTCVRTDARKSVRACALARYVGTRLGAGVWWQVWRVHGRVGGWVGGWRERTRVR